MGLICFDVFGVESAANKATAGAERLSALGAKVGSAPLPPMRSEDRAAVQAALSAASTAVRAPVSGIRNVAGEMRARSTLLLRDIQESSSSFFNMSGLALGLWAGSEESLERTLAQIRKKYKVSGEALDAQLKKHQKMGRGRGRVTKNEKARLRALREDNRFWTRWLRRADNLATGPWAKPLARISRVLGHPALGPGIDFLSVAFGSPMLNNWGSKGVAGGTYAGSNIALAAVPGGAAFALVDSLGMLVLGKHGYSQVSISNMNTTTAQTLGAFDQAIRTGDYSGLEQIHQASLDGKTTAPQTAGAYIGAVYSSGDAAGYHEESMAGQHGAGAQTMSMVGQTEHEIITNPGRAVSDAVDYWGSYF